MYIAYGWPRVVSTACVSSNHQIVYLKASPNGLLLVASSSHLEIWSITHHKIRLGNYTRDVDSVKDEGQNMHAIWSLDSKTVLVFTSAHFIHCYTLSDSNEQLHLNGKESTELTLMHVKFSSRRKAPFADDVSISNFVAEKYVAALGLSNGFLYLVSWSGEFLGSLNLLEEAGFPSFAIQRRENHVTSPVHCILTSQYSYKGPLLDRANGLLHLELSMQLHVIVAVLQDGHAFQCSVNKNGLKKIGDVAFERWIPISDAVCASIASEQSILAIGSKRGIVCLFDLANNTSLLRTISLYDWGYELCFYPRYHLDESSLLYRKALLDKPIVMDVWQDYILVTYPPFDVHVFCAKLSGTLSPSKVPVLQLVTVRELSIMTAKKQPVAMRFIPHRTFGDGIFSPRGDFHSKEDGMISTVEMLQNQPSRCLILRMNGELSLLDLDEGSERNLTTDVELFWVTYGQPEGKANLIEEVSWLAYGHNGMQVWYPSSEADAYQLQDFLQLDPELEFDREVYPLGIMPYSGLVVGVSQRLSFSAGAEMPCFEPSPQAQTILHCLLRHLLQRGKTEEALQLARLSAGRSHFSHCLEWLLFTVFDAVVSSHGTSKSEWSSPIRWSPFLLLQQACDLIRNFSEYLDVVVSVARKTDGRHWADLFAAAGKSTELFDECLKRRCYQTAACYILVIEKLEGTAISQYNALRLLQATLEESFYELAGELVRFLLRSGRELDVMNGDLEKKPSSLLNTFLFGSNFGKDQPNQVSKSPIPKDINANMATVKKMLENHANSLMSRKELRELVAFVKGTQFDLTEFLQSSDGKASRLHDFVSALQEIGQKLDMDVLQSRLDAEFLLAHMCTVGFKEWIVVLATLLRRVEVLLDLFRDDLRLWQAYSSTIRSQAGFAEFDDLVVTVEDALTTMSR